MSLPHYDIVFRGVREGFDVAKAKRLFAIQFKLHPEKVERIFSSRKAILKTSVNDELADKYIARLARIGVVADKIIIHGGDNISASNATVKVVSPSIAIFYKDQGAESFDAGSMHQPVDYLYGQHVRRIPFEFTGRGIDYFKIWIVNIIVCCISLGLLYPWARMRSQRFFYQHTLLDGSEFNCSFKLQRLFFLQLFIVFVVVGTSVLFWNGFIRYGFAVSVCLLLMLPFYAYKRSDLRWSQSSYRQLFFHSKNTLLEFYGFYVLWPLLVIISGGLIAPLAFYKTHKFLIEKKSLAHYEFVFTAAFIDYLFLLPTLVVAGIITFILFHWAVLLPSWIALAGIAITWLSILIYWRVQLTNKQWNSTQLAVGHFVSDWTLSSYAGLMLRNSIFCVLTLGFYWPWAITDLARYKAGHLAFFANPAFKKCIRADVNNE